MFNYVIRRLILMIPTFFGTTLLVFVILQAVPDGPFEQALRQIKQANMLSGEGARTSSGSNQGSTVSKEILDWLKAEYGLDKSVMTRYFIWLGLAKKEIKRKDAEIGIPYRETLSELGQGKYVPISLQRWVVVDYDEDGKLAIWQSSVGTDFKWKSEENYPILEDPELIEEWAPSEWKIKKHLDGEMVSLIIPKRQGLFSGYLGTSDKYEEPVAKLMWDRIHISLFLGVTGFILSYLICIPLGIMKALKHGSKFDIVSSGLVFIGYSIPAYAFGVLMLWIFSTSQVFDAPILPSRGWRPEDWEQ